MTGTRITTTQSEATATIGRDERVTPGCDKTPRGDDAYRAAVSCTGIGTRIPGRRISSIISVLIVADVRKVAGAETGPVADYIAMLALSEPRLLDDCNALPSILDLMAKGGSAREAPKALTDSDIAYLKGLYAADLGATTNLTQKERIEGGMKGEMGK